MTFWTEYEEGGQKDIERHRERGTCTYRREMGRETGREIVRER